MGKPTIQTTVLGELLSRLPLVKIEALALLECHRVVNVVVVCVLLAQFTVLLGGGREPDTALVE